MKQPLEMKVCHCFLTVFTHICVEAATVAFNLARLAKMMSDPSIEKMATVLQLFAESKYPNPLNFVQDITDPFCSCFFPKYLSYIFTLLLELLKHGAHEKKKAVLMVLRSFLVYIDISKVEVDNNNFFYELFIFLKDMVNSEFRKLVIPILELLINLTSGYVLLLYRE
jgi:hypothetical protein